MSRYIDIQIAQVHISAKSAVKCRPKRTAKLQHRIAVALHVMVPTTAKLDLCRSQIHCLDTISCLAVLRCLAIVRYQATIRYLATTCCLLHYVA